MGCIMRLGCLAVLLVLGVGAYLTRGKWMSKVRNEPPAVATAPVWEPLSPAAGERGKRAIESLSASSGPVYTNVKANEIASYVFQTVGRGLPTSADSVEAAVIGDALFVRAVLPVKELAGSGVLGPLGGLLNDREKISLGGSFRVVRPGMSEMTVREIKLRDFNIPKGAIPRLLRQISKGERPAGIADDALPVPTPRTLGDVRIANGRITLYKITAEAPTAEKP